MSDYNSHFTRFVFKIFLLGLALLLSSVFAYSAKAFDCPGGEGQIAISECQALNQLYNANGGADWSYSGVAPGWSSGVNCQSAGIRCGGDGTGDYHVLSLYLDGAGMTGTLADDAFSQLPYLEKIDFTNNNLSGLIPSSLTGLRQLRTLYLGINQFTGTIPESLLGNEVLPEASSTYAGGTLDLSSNQLSGELPQQIGYDAASQLFFNDNPNLSGPIPLTYAGLTDATSFYDLNTAVCIPDDPAIADWLAGLQGAWYSVSNVQCQSTTPELRPVFVLPGIYGSYFFSDAAHDQWNLHRGVDPDQLQIDPLLHGYDDIVQTLKNVGYEEGKNLFVVAYDWRLTPGPVDGVFDGVLDGLSADSITDDSYQYGVDYLGYYLAKAAESWDVAHPDQPLGAVDIISHSTGGLVARSYIQSAAYEGSFFSTARNKTLTLPGVENLIMVAVPNRGASQPWQAMDNNFIADLSSKYVMAKMLNVAYKKVLAGKTITGFPHDITLASISTNGIPDRREFISQYVPTFRSLLATYDFLFDEHRVLTNVNLWEDVRNDLLLDLNNGLDDPALSQSRDHNLFADLVTTSNVIYSDTVSTEYRVRYRNTGGANVVFRFDYYQETDLPDGVEWYSGVSSVVGDGTVPVESSAGQFLSDDRVQTHRETNGKIKHTELMANPLVQQRILDIMGTPWLSGDISTALARTSAGSAFWNAFIDPVDMVVVDGVGRRFGYLTATGPLTEIPNSVWFGGADGIGWIFGNVVTPLHIELKGHGEDYLVQFSGAEARKYGGFEGEGFLGLDEEKTEQVEITNLFSWSLFLPSFLHGADPGK